MTSEVPHMATAGWAGLRRQARKASLVITGSALFVLVVAAASVFLILPDGEPASKLSLDPSYITQSPWWYGAISYLGLLLMAAAAGIFGVVAHLIRRVADRSARFVFLAVAALVSTLFLLDDTYEIHEVILPGWGVPKPVVYVLYVVVALAFVTFLRRVWLRTEYVVMFAAFAAFAVSVFLDVVFTRPFIEDCFKLLGVVLWFCYAARTSVLLLTEANTSHATVGTT